MRLVRDGLALAVDDAGGAGLPVVFQHGLTASAAQAREAFPGGPRFRRITLECRGHGASPLGGDLSIAAFADDVAALVERVGAPAALGGISMGAAIALRLAVTRPGLVRALILVRPAWVAEAAPPNMAVLGRIGALLEALPPDAARAAFDASGDAAHLAAESPDNLASAHGFFTRDPLADTARLLRVVAADGPGVTEAQVAALRLPALVCGTDMDAVHPLAQAERLAALIPGARLTVVPPKSADRAGHFAALHAAITGFLTELP